MSLAPLHRLLDQQIVWPPETRGQLSSHLPMALHALHSMGADEARLQAFFDRYRGRFESLQPLAAAAPPADWRSLRGSAHGYAALRAGFALMLERDGTDAVLRHVLPDLLSGMAAAAFHGPIRTAHAVESSHRGELAAALAYWAWRWQPLVPPPAGAPLAFDDWLPQFAATTRGWRTEDSLISRRIDDATRSAPYLAWAGRLAPAPDLFPRLAAFAVGCYADSRNFTVLHLVTGLRALRVLGPWFDAAAAAPHLIHAFAAAVLAARLPAQPAALAAPPRAWPEVISAACASDDDHVIKIVHACREEAAVYGPGRYLEAASVAVA